MTLTPAVRAALREDLLPALDELVELLDATATRYPDLSAAAIQLRGRVDALRGEVRDVLRLDDAPVTVNFTRRELRQLLEFIPDHTTEAGHALRARLVSLLS